MGFSYTKTNKNVRVFYRNGQWENLEETDSEEISMHMAASSLHYGQACFEGIKAFHGQDGKIRIFRMDENAKRLAASARRLLMPEVPFELFTESVKKAVELNKELVPPYESGATLYIRPLLIGTGVRMDLHPADEYLFVVFTMPVGPYFKDGFKPVDVLVEREYDRAAPLGTGNVKAAGNYAASMLSIEKGHKKGYALILYLDSCEKKYIDECGPANFFAIKGNSYITPDSKSILPSITNMSLQAIAREMGMKVEIRKIALEELNEFDEVGACGTAAVIAPIKKIVDEENNKTFAYCPDGNPGPISTKLYNKLRAIQYGTAEDKWGWNK